MRFSSKKAKDLGSRRASNIEAQGIQNNTEAKVLFRLCRERKFKEFKCLASSLQKRGTIGGLLNQPDFSNKDGDTLLHVAAHADNLETVDLLLSLGANPSTKNMRNETPAHTAARAGNLEILKFLVENGGLHGILDDLIIRSR